MKNTPSTKRKSAGRKSKKDLPADPLPKNVNAMNSSSTLGTTLSESVEKCSSTDSSISSILAERERQYGSNYPRLSELSQNLKDSLRRHPKYELLPWDVRETLDMVEHKISRIVNGNPNFIDSWQDIIGYVQLVINRINLHAERVQESGSR